MWMVSCSGGYRLFALISALHLSSEVAKVVMFFADGARYTELLTLVDILGVVASQTTCSKMWCNVTELKRD